MKKLSMVFSESRNQRENTDAFETATLGDFGKSTFSKYDGL
jgi:hypothetical protein